MFYLFFYTTFRAFSGPTLVRGVLINPLGKRGGKEQQLHFSKTLTNISWDGYFHFYSWMECTLWHFICIKHLVWPEFINNKCFWIENITSWFWWWRTEAKLVIVFTYFFSSSSSFFVFFFFQRLLLFTHFGDTQEAICFL